jgi:hypothetical protein
LVAFRVIKMELSRIAEMYALGKVPIDDLPAAAIEALEAGLDSPTLRQLAGADGADAETIRNLFSKSLGELGIPIPSPSEAGLAFARHIAGEIVRGVLAPYDGAKQIWHIYTRFPELGRLRIFVGMASEYEDDETHRENYSRSIVEESRKLMGIRHD